MKKLLIPVITCFFIACSGGDDEKDSVEMAKEENNIKDSSAANTGEFTEDYNFAVEAASGNKMEIQLGQYASKNAASASVKQFGQMIVADHTKTDSLLTDIAQVKGLVIPSTPGDAHQKHIDELTKKKGADFDKAYIDMMVDDHEEDIRKFEDEAKNGKNEDIKSFANQVLPVLRKHLDAAKKIKDGLK